MGFLFLVPSLKLYVSNYWRNQGGDEVEVKEEIDQILWASESVLINYAAGQCEEIVGKLR